MQTFISHKSLDKQEAIRLKAYLESCFITSWLDKDELKGGDALSSSFIAGVKGKTTVALVSEAYLDSNWCQDEFKMAYNGHITKRGTLLLVILGTEADARVIKKKAEEIGFSELVTYMEMNKYLLYNIYNAEQSCVDIAETVQKNNPIRFKPLKQITVGGQRLQFIDFDMDKHVPLEVFQTWQVDLMDFMDLKGDDSKPIKKEIPVAFFGKGPCWLYAFLSTPFANKNEVFVYNEPSNKYLCVYARNTNREMMGKIIGG